MDELVDRLVEKVGIDKETARKVVDFLKEHASELPKWLGENETLRGVAERFNLGGLFGGQKD
jgi:hypothetical protein